MSDLELQQYIENSIKIITEKLNIPTPVIDFGHLPFSVIGYKPHHKSIFIAIPQLYNIYTIY